MMTHGFSLRLSFAGRHQLSYRSSSCFLCSLSLIPVLSVLFCTTLYIPRFSLPRVPSHQALFLSFPHYYDNCPVLLGSLANLEGWVTACRRQPSKSPTMTSVGTRRLKSLSRRWVSFILVI